MTGVLVLLLSLLLACATQPSSAEADNASGLHWESHVIGCAVPGTQIAEGDYLVPQPTELPVSVVLVERLAAEDGGFALRNRWGGDAVTETGSVVIGEDLEWYSGGAPAWLACSSSTATLAVTYAYPAE